LFSLIRVYDEASNVIATHRAQGRFQRVVKLFTRTTSRSSVKHIL
jgi:hypothetical protein